MDLNEQIRIFALQNAAKFKGKANPGSIIPKVIGLDPANKEKIKEIVPEINKIVKEVNALSLEEQQQELAAKGIKKEEKKKDTKKDLKDLNKTENGVVMRFAPSPSGPMHIGHAATGSLSSLYADKYKGTFYLRIEDTNASNIYEPAYAMLAQEADWLFGNVKEVVIQSERMKRYYEVVEELIKKDVVYIDTTDPEKFREYVQKKENAPTRSATPEETQKLWEKMLSTDPQTQFKAGEAVLRFKSGMDHPNPAMRDFPLFRINEEAHPKTQTEYRAWPLMNLSVAVDDMDLGMTHVIRAKDHLDNAKKQELIYKACGKTPPESYFLGKLNFDDMAISASKTREAIEKGEFDGWDDIRLPFLAALRRRGYQPEAFKRFSKEVGLSQVDKVFTKDQYFKLLNGFNKEFIEKNGFRFFAIREPVEITVANAPEKTVELDLHPDHKKGGRVFSVNDKFVIEQSDVDLISDGEVIRLIDAINIKKEGDSFVYVSDSYDEFKGVGKRVIHWLPQDAEQQVKGSVLMPDKTEQPLLMEKTISTIGVDDVLQFERFGFVRLDNKENYSFWFGHK